MVSVIIPAFRSAGYIAETLASVFNQSYRDLEVIVVNDGSPDTSQLIDALGPWRHLIQYLEQENGGAGAARNAGLAHAGGDLVAFLDADDRWLPHFLESQVALLEARPGWDMVYANARITGDTPLAGRTFMDTTPSEGPVSFHSLLMQRCTVITSSVVARRAAIESVGGFDASLRRGQDFDLWLRLAHAAVRISYQREPLIERIVRADGLSADPITELKRARRVLKGVRKKLALDAALELERGKRCLRHGGFDEARGHFQRSLALIPCWKVRLGLMLMSVAPRAFQRAYVRFRPPTPAETLAAQ